MREAFGNTGIGYGSRSTDSRLGGAGSNPFECIRFRGLGTARLIATHPSRPRVAQYKEAAINEDHFLFWLPSHCLLWLLRLCCVFYVAFQPFSLREQWDGSMVFSLCDGHRLLRMCWLSTTAPFFLSCHKLLRLSWQLLLWDGVFTLTVYMATDFFE